MIRDIQAIIFIFMVIGFTTFSTGQATEQNSLQTHLPKWQLGLGVFAATVPHYPASNHYYELITPSPLFIYRFGDATLERGSLAMPLTERWRLSLQLGFNPPVGENNKEDSEFSSEAKNGKRVVSEDNFHRRGMEALPSIMKLGGQIAYQIHPHMSLQLPLFLNIGLDKLDYQGYELHPEVSVSLRPHYQRQALEGFDVTGSVEFRYGDLTVNQLYYEVQPDDAIIGREAYSANTGELFRSLSVSLSYQHYFNYNHLVRWFLSWRHLDFSHSANTGSPLHVVNQSNIIATGFSYYFFSSDAMVKR